MLINVIPYGSKTSFVANIVSIWVLVEDKLLTVFIYRIVCQMHAEVVEVAAKGTLVLLSGKPS